MRIYLRGKSTGHYQLYLTPNTPLHIEDFTRARVNESDLTEVLVENCAMPILTKSQNH